MEVFQVTDGKRFGECHSYYDHFEVFWDDGDVNTWIAELSIFGIRKVF